MLSSTMSFGAAQRVDSAHDEASDDRAGWREFGFTFWDVPSDAKHLTLDLDGAKYKL